MENFALQLKNEHKLKKNFGKFLKIVIFLAAGGI